MTIIVGLLVGLLGLALAVVGLAFFAMFRLALRTFDQSLKAEVAAQGRDQVERAAMKIRNPFIRNFVLKHLVGTGGSMAVSMVRGGLQSRMRTGLYIAIAGASVLLLSFFTGHWLPQLWPAA